MLILTMIWMYAAQAAQAVAAAVPKHPSASALGSQVTIAYLVTNMLEYLKSKSWAPFVQKNAATLNKISAGFFALVSAVGVSYAWDSTNRQIVLSNIPTASMVLVLGWTWIKQWAFQEMVYHGWVQTPAVAPAPPPDAPMTRTA